jgi:hypothetical protein
MKNIEDYIHLYCNGKTLVRWKESVDYEDLLSHRLIHDLFDQANATDIKLILRPLDSMTEEEAKEVGWWDDWENRIAYAKDFKEDWMFSASNMLYLLKNGFDIFSLIPDGLALNRNTI